jgi:hypothetical protein
LIDSANIYFSKGLGCVVFVSDSISLLDCILFLGYVSETALYFCEFSESDALTVRELRSSGWYAG